MSESNQVSESVNGEVVSGNNQVTESVNRYRIEEFQDHNGNVIYPQTDARGVSDEQINTILNGGSES